MPVAEAVRRCRELPLPDHLVPSLARWPDPHGLVEQGLRQWFEVHVRDPRWPLGLPSVAVEAAWTVAVADQEGYARFCDAVFGRLLPFTHDTPRMGRTWAAACQAESLDARHPPHLPVLFLVDQTLHLPDGRSYDSRCSGRVCRVEAPTVCVRHAFVHTSSPVSWFTARTSIDVHPS